MRSGHLRGNDGRALPLTFLRFKPLVIPKRSLTDDATERVHTRVLPAIYRIESTDWVLFSGQQMDTFIEAQE